MYRKKITDDSGGVSLIILLILMQYSILAKLCKQCWLHCMDVEKAKKNYDRENKISDLNDLITRYNSKITKHDYSFTL